MKAELTFPPELAEQIADSVIQKLLPLLESSNSNGDDEILNIKEASEYMKTSKEQIYQWVSDAKHGLGTFPYKKSGKRLRFSRKDLLNWMDLCR